jgi:hypothetical protein
MSAALVELTIAALLFLIGVAGQFACANSGCYPGLTAEAVLLALADAIVFAVVLIPRSSGRPRRLPLMLAATLAVPTAAYGILNAVLWSGVAANYYFGDHTNPWRDSPIASASTVLVLTHDFAAGKIHWLGGPAVVLFGFVVSVVAYCGIAVSCGVVAIAVVRSSGHALRPRLLSVLRRPAPLLVLVLASSVFAADAFWAAPAVAAEAADTRVLRDLVAAQEHLQRVNAARATYRAACGPGEFCEPSGSQTVAELAADLGRAAAPAYRDFDGAVSSIRFPERVRQSLLALLQADAEVIAAANALYQGGASLNIRIQAWNLSRDRQDAALRSLRSALLPPPD